MRIRVHARDRTIVSGPTAGQASPEAFARIGHAVKDFGAALETYIREQEQAEDFDANRRWAEFRAASQAGFAQAKARADGGATGFARAAVAEHDRQARAFLASLPPRLRPAYAQRAEESSKERARDATAFERGQEQRFEAATLTRAETSHLATLEAEPERLDEARADYARMVGLARLDPAAKARRLDAFRVRAEETALAAALTRLGRNAGTEDEARVLITDERFAAIRPHRRGPLLDLYRAAFDDLQRQALAEQVERTRTALRLSQETRSALSAGIAQAKVGAWDIASKVFSGALLPVHAPDLMAELGRQAEETKREAALLGDLINPDKLFTPDPQLQADIDLLDRRRDGAKHLQERSDAYVDLELAWLMARTGLAPRDAVARLTGLSGSDDPAAAAWALEAMKRLKAAAPEAFSRAFGERARAILDAYERLIVSGRTPEQAALTAGRSAPP